ncbi:hypothetical protein KZO01_23810 [Kurthia zopfii]|uniref:DNA polymerase III polC-type n=1 Tax=Kurthia zopfii TaxID=1650 RepID=A0A8B4Q4T0_9BACL|nr:3'-5' exonuclease [Kurthia zopfii]PWI21607.1 hypothetical protein DF281_11525 [Kurthia zopfii]TDR33598.1 DNA polymerase-3 subunit epsilon [Kurthia zopfii]GEK32072.1 hypothetical protein KZO01_23810 [Kurthia zopfii]STX08842.1 DNA polymerase III polC-type [Kurthia zopfii]
MENLLHKGLNVLFFDIETTGFPKKNEPVDIIEIGMQYVPELGFSKEIETLDQLYSIDGIVPYEITEITGIKGSMLEGKPHIKEHLNLIQNTVSKSDVIVAHNAPFDIRCLELLGVNFADKEIFDTATHSKRMFPELPSHKMGAMCEFLGINNIAAHRAIHDVNAMIKVYSEIADFNKYPEKLEELIEKHKKLSYTKKLTVKA